MHTLVELVRSPWRHWAGAESCSSTATGATSPTLHGPPSTQLSAEGHAVGSVGRARWRAPTRTPAAPRPPPLLAPERPALGAHRPAPAAGNTAPLARAPGPDLVGGGVVAVSANGVLGDPPGAPPPRRVSGCSRRWPRDAGSRPLDPLDPPIRRLPPRRLAGSSPRVHDARAVERDTCRAAPTRARSYDSRVRSDTAGDRATRARARACRTPARGSQVRGVRASSSVNHFSSADRAAVLARPAPRQARFMARNRPRRRPAAGRPRPPRRRSSPAKSIKRTRPTSPSGNSLLTPTRPRAALTEHSPPRHGCTCSTAAPPPRR